MHYCLLNCFNLFYPNNEITWKSSITFVKVHLRDCQRIRFVPHRRLITFSRRCLWFDVFLYIFICQRSIAPLFTTSQRKILNFSVVTLTRRRKRTPPELRNSTCKYRYNNACEWNTLIIVVFPLNIKRISRKCIRCKVSSWLDNIKNDRIFTSIPKRNRSTPWKTMTHYPSPRVTWV